MDNKISVQRVCSKCGEINEIGAEELKIKWVHSDFDEYYNIVYYECKRCKEKQCVQVDTKQTLELKRKLIRILLQKKDREKYNKIDKKLNELRCNLQRKVNGLKLYDENGNIFTNGLTILKEDDIIDSDM
jgi:hypothetical protein